MESLPKVLYIDDEPQNLKSFIAGFRKDFEINTAETTTDAEKILAEQDFEVIICDQKLGLEKGTDFLEKIHPQYPKSYKVIVTAFQEFEAVKSALNSGIILKFITKPWKNEELFEAVKMGSDFYRLREEKERLLTELLKAKEEIKKLLDENKGNSVENNKKRLLD